MYLWGKIDKEPICDRCGAKATHYLKRLNSFFNANFEHTYCNNCLKIMRTFFRI